MSSENIRRRVTVHGEVQGVYFRDSTKEQAEAEGVAGWVTNRSDGGVEVVLEGPQEKVQRLVDFCREGPQQADVENVDVQEEEAEGLSGFEVR